MKWIPKGWGGEKILVNTENYCGKLLLFIKGHRCSVHYHKLKDETFYVHRGSFEIRYHDDVSEIEKYLNAYGSRGLCDKMEKVILGQGDTFYVPPGRVHQMIALEDSELFEFSTQHFDSDSYRLVRGD